MFFAVFLLYYQNCALTKWHEQITEIGVFCIDSISQGDWQRNTVVKLIRKFSNQVSISSTFYVQTCLYEHCFSSFFYVHLHVTVTREKLPKQRSYEKFVRKMLMKLTKGLQHWLPPTIQTKPHVHIISSVRDLYRNKQKQMKTLKLKFTYKVWILIEKSRFL